MNCIRMTREMSVDESGTGKMMPLHGIEVGFYFKENYPGEVIYMKMDAVKDFVMEEGEFAFDVKFYAETYSVTDHECSVFLYSGTILPGGMHHGEGVLSTNGNPSLVRYSGEFELGRQSSLQVLLRA